ncbi:GPP34 family phosphoprotein [Dactylosporangium sucinum]|uniref:Peptidase M48 domain-containing protein n=1 Tax=Dactylosporangium sucinum TaxID=1424081 RepID=A0A917TTJ8_9ACTN|nr:GPP34 family phosphoprotein [Dactylosporangium sucinum]GGM37516.1 hypothetical protein GCM10007977_043690 [Dactylosporangium sucinum]
MDGGGRAATLRALAAVAMLVGFWALAVALPIGLGWLAVWSWMTMPGSGAPELLSLLAVTAGVGVAIPIWQLLRARPDPPDEGVAVDEAAAPELWRQVRELAAAVGTRPPDEIRLVGRVNASVWEDTGLLGLRGGRRHLYVGVPLLLVWPVSWVRAFLAHELGHYSGQHARLTSVTYRGAHSMLRTIARVGPHRPAGKILSVYAWLYMLVFLAVGRRTELEADAAAARAAGREAIAGALGDAPALVGTWNLLVSGYARWARTEAYEPGELLARFARDPRHAPPVEPELDDQLRTHPPIAARLARIARLPDGACGSDPGGGETGEQPAIGLVAGPEVLEAALRTPDFHAVIEAAAAHEASLDADRLRSWGRLGDAVNALGTRAGAGLIRRLGPATRRADGRRDPGDAGEYIVSAAIAAGCARWVHAWSRPLQVEPPELVPAVAATCRDPAAVVPLQRLLADLGLPGVRVPLRTGELREEQLADVLFDLSFGPDGRRRLNLRTFPAGLAAAALIELSVHGRVVVGDDDQLAIAGDPTGDEFLDSVLDAVAGGRPRTAHEWLLHLGDAVTDTVAARARLRGRYDARSASHALNRLADPGTTNAVRARILAALEAGDLDGPDVALGMVLWATELSGQVLGRRAVLARWQLARFGARNNIARAVRVVIGLGSRVSAP